MRKNLEPTKQFINYAAYLLADENGVSVKVAVYAGIDKVDLASALGGIFKVVINIGI